jgi:hypothetical protein
MDLADVREAMRLALAAMVVARQTLAAVDPPDDEEVLEQSESLPQPDDCDEF